MPNYDFKKDLVVAKATEIQIADWLTKVYDAEILAFEKTNKYDILVKIKNKEYKFEIKEDFTCERTGNVGLEFECRGKPSGIQTSEADYYIYKIHTPNGARVYFIKTETLKEMVKKKEYFRIVNGGDKGSNSMNYLFKYETFVRNSIFPNFNLDKNQ